MNITGECFCGRVKYAICGQLKNARSCHCSRCRKVFSGQASAYAEVDPNTFSWIQGEDLLTRYATGDQFGLQFCSLCGSTLCGMYAGKVHGVTLGCLNEDPGITIEKHIYVGSKAAWEVIPDTVTQFEADAPA